MFAYLKVLFVVPNVVEVGFEPFHEALFCLTHVLNPAPGAGEAQQKVKKYAFIIPLTPLKSDGFSILPA